MEPVMARSATAIKNPKFVVAVAAFAAFIATFNETYLNVAFAPIMADLGVTVSVVQWLATAYMLGAAVMVPVSAFAYRSIPTKPLFLCTVALLVIGSVIGALAQTFPVLLAGRIVQALGTGLLIPVGMNITLEAAPREKLGIYMGIMGSMTTLGPSLSVVIAGGLLNFFDWHMLLWVFAGLSFACFLTGALFLHNIAKLTKPRLDAISVALVGIAFIGILYGISTVFAGNKIIAALAVVVGIVFLVCFVSRQKKIASPLINLSPLAIKPFSIGVIINMISLVTMFAMNIIIPIFMQSVLGVSSITASLTLFPAIALCCVLSPLAGRIYDKRGAKVLLPLGFMLITIFAVALSMFISTGNAVLLALLYIPVIGGSALIIGPVQSLALSHLAPEQNPHGVTILSTGFQIAGCFGASLFTGVYFGVTTATQGDAVKGFIAAGFLTALFALIGFCFALAINKYKKAAAVHAIQPTVRSIMKTEVYSISDAATVLDAMKMLDEKNISGMPVLNASGQIVGMINDTEIIAHFAKRHTSFINIFDPAGLAASLIEDFDSELRELINHKAIDIAEKEFVTVNADDELSTVCLVMLEHNMKKVPVVDKGAMVGIINRSNITKYAMNEYLKKAGK